MTDLLGSYTPLAPLFWVAAAGLLMMLVDAFVKERAELALTTAVVLVAGAGISLSLWDTPPTEVLGTWVAADRLAIFIDVTACAGGALAALLAGGYLREHGLERGEFFILLLFSTFGAMALGRATDLLTIFVALETLSLGAYGLVAYRRHSPRALEGAMKYFLLGSFAAAILLFGGALLYGATGHTDLAGVGASIAAGDADLRLVMVGIALVVVGLGFKISAVPFHTWTPDAYEGAVTPATTFMAVVVKASVFGVLLRVLFVALGDEGLTGSTGWPPVLGFLAAVTMVVGNVAAIGQKSVKRMLAYSSVAHGGFILIGVVAATEVGESAIAATLFYLLAYTVSNVLAFGALILAGSKGKEAVSYDDLAGLGRRNPMVAMPFVLGLLSLMGFPPTAGFFAKYYVLMAAVQGGGWLLWLAILGVITSAIGAYYYLRVVVYLFMKQPEPGAPLAVPMRSFYVASALALSAYFVLRMGLAPDAYLEMAAASAPAIEAGPSAGEIARF
jgi:NADH-quinone oxidoreductase subunit N